MPNYRINSNWNDEMELRCLLIFKKLEEEGFPRNRQTELCNELSKHSGMAFSTLNAKVGNYKSVARINKPANDSSNTKRIYDQYENLSSTEIYAVITQNY